MCWKVNSPGSRRAEVNEDDGGLFARDGYERPGAGPEVGEEKFPPSSVRVFTPSALRGGRNGGAGDRLAREVTNRPLNVLAASDARAAPRRRMSAISGPRGRDGEAE